MKVVQLKKIENELEKIESMYQMFVQNIEAAKLNAKLMHKEVEEFQNYYKRIASNLENALEGFRQFRRDISLESELERSVKEGNYEVPIDEGIMAGVDE